MSVSFPDGWVWKLEDLNDEQREIAEEAGCEPQTYYLGYPNVDNEIPECPNCGAASWSESPCKHLVVEYDLNGGFTHIFDGYERYFWKFEIPQHIAGGNTVSFEDYLEDEDFDALIGDDIFEVSPLSEVSTESAFGDRGLTCGYASDEYLAEMQRWLQVNIEK